MKVIKKKNLYQLTPAIFPVNCFVYETATSLVVIDMGNKLFIEEVRKLELKTEKKVTVLLLTHAHGDHVNGVAKFKKVFPTVKVGISVRDNKLLEGDFSLLKDEANKKIKGGFPKEPIPIDFMFQPEQEIEGLRIVACPGHTPGSVAFLDNEGVLIAGDALQLCGGIAVAGIVRPLFPFPAFGTWDARTALASAKVLVELQPKLLAVGHGTMLEHPVAEMTQAIRTAERKLQDEKDY
ncbi:MBL fold metallo-hydrolase [Candidatus Enterococcus ferrettii]|uniref:Metallo-beta-lactamase domain-containing protein n=1 Tax=Candidatus Enterococcus ferrettii TaxID=2815324 RepID=A0ABV0EUG7_9ENTE|nr:MBL fold metallo-hydrolase [Enterococcus sp. 665A]MBO1339415.1 MBL fold metallo-hydrolase [Enterococcus sp. 665A]